MVFAICSCTLDNSVTLDKYVTDKQFSTWIAKTHAMAHEAPTLTNYTAGPLGFIIGINEPGDNTEPKKLKIIWITYKGTIFEA